MSPGHHGFWPGPLRLGEQLPLRALESEGDLRPAPGDLHPRARPRREGEGGDPWRDGPAALVLGAGLIRSHRASKRASWRDRAPSDVTGSCESERAQGSSPGFRVAFQDAGGLIESGEEFPPLPGVGEDELAVAVVVDVAPPSLGDRPARGLVVNGA